MTTRMGAARRLRTHGCVAAVVLLAIASESAEAIPNPTTFTVTAEYMSIFVNIIPTSDLSYASTMVIRSQDPISWSPTTGANYPVGSEVAPGVFVTVKEYAIEPYGDYPLVPGTRYYYKAYSVDLFYGYSSGLAGDAVPSGTPPAIADCTDVHAVPGTGCARLTWTNPSDPAYASTLVVRFTQNDLWFPTDGTFYQPGQEVGGGVVVCNAPLIRFVDTGLKNLHQYWYRVFAVTTEAGHSFGVSVAATPAKEPSSHYYEFVREWGQPGTGPGEFDPGWGPRGITVVRRPGSPAPEVHVSDLGNYRVQSFALDGQYLDSSDAHGRYHWRDDLAWSPCSDFVMSTGRNCGVTGPWGGTSVCRYYPLGFEGNCTYELYTQPSYGSLCQTSVPLASGPVCPAVAAVVSDDDKVWLFTPPHGDFQSWGTSGTGDGQLFGPTSIVQDKTGAYLYVGDETGRIQKFLFNGTFVEKIQFPRDDGTMGDRLSEVPLDMAVDRWGCFYVASNGHKILKFDPNWKFLTGWGRKGSSPGEFGSDTVHALRIWVDEDDRVYVSDAGNCRVQVFQESDRNGTDIHFNALIAEPVNTCTGNFTYQHTDLVIPGRGIGVTFSRSYNSQSQYEGTLGPGWRHSYDIALLPKDDGSRVICWGDGREITYLPDPGDPNNYLPASPGVYDTLVDNGDDTFTLTAAQGQTRYNFDVDGRLTSIIDKNSNIQALAHNALGRLTTITDPSGRPVTLAYGGNGKLASVTDPLARVISYGYTPEGELSSVTDACGNPTQYTYDADHQMLTLVDPRAHQIISNTYDLYRRVISQTNARGAETTFEYLTEQISTPFGPVNVYKGITRVTEAVGTGVERQSEHHYDSRGRLVKIIHPDALTTEHAYDDENNRTSVKDRNGHTTYYAFDSQGNMTTKTDPLGGQTPITYDAKNNPTSRTDPTGRTTTFEYDPVGNLIRSIDPMGYETVMAYDAWGQLTSMTDAEGRIEEYAYDADGNLTSKTDRRSKVWQYTYDSVGRKLTEADPTGATTQYEYDGCDRVIRIIDALSQDSTFMFDANGNKTQEDLPGGRTLSYTYDENDNLLTATDANGNVTGHSYDLLDRREQTTDALGGQTDYEHDALDRLVCQTDANGHSWQYTFDGNGNRLTGTDHSGNTWQYTYDELNRQIAVTDPLGNTTTTAYDEAGRVLSVTNAAGDTTSFQYDLAGRKTDETDYRGNTTHFTYDAVGNVIAVTDPLGYTTQHSYDGNDNRTSTTNPLGQTTTFVYDDVNRLIQAIDALGNTTTNTYDALGRLTSVTDPNGNAHVYDYDPPGNLTMVTEPTGAVTEYTYDANGNMLTFRNARQKVTAYTYDALDRKISKTDPLGLTRSYTYDPVGNLITMTDEHGLDTTYQCDSNDRLIQVDYPGGLTVTYQYDAAGKRIGMTDGIGTSTYSYDCCGHRLGYQDPFGQTIGYGSDENGNRVLLIYPDGKQVTYEYDVANRMTTVTDWDSRVTTYEYDDADRVARNTLPNGTYCEYAYDDAGRLVSRVSRKPDHTVIVGYTLTLDPAGNRIQIDVEGALQASPPPETVAYTYDDADRIISAGTTSFDFSNRGNMVRKAEPGNVVTDYTYDGRDRLTGVSAPGVSFSARYDGVGNRLETTDSGIVQRAVIDDDAPLPQPLCHTGNAGTIQSYYIYGPGATLLYEMPVVSPAHFFHFDYIGSIAALTDLATGITDQYAYDEFGSVLATNGATETTFRYVGEYGVMSEVDNLLYMRARYYYPSLGRFGAVDTVPGDWRTPSGLNVYSYAGSNPVLQIDPSGRTSSQWDVLWSVVSSYVGMTTGAVSEGLGRTYSALASADDIASGARNQDNLASVGHIMGGIHNVMSTAGVGGGPAVAASMGTTVLGWTQFVPAVINTALEVPRDPYVQKGMKLGPGHTLDEYKAALGLPTTKAKSDKANRTRAVVVQSGTVSGPVTTPVMKVRRAMPWGKRPWGIVSRSVFTSGAPRSPGSQAPIPLTPETYEPKYRPINKVRAKDM